MDYCVLGPLTVRRGGNVVRLRGAKQQALLTILLLNANRVVSADRLTDQLWGEEPPASGAPALRVRVSQLRKALEVPGLKNPIRTRAPGYLIIVRRDQLDLSVFEDRLERGSAALSAGNASEAAGELDEALALWRGPALADVEHEEFARAAAIRLEELRLHALELRVEAELGLGQAGRLVGELQALVEEHPLNERFRGQLMQALYATGRQSEALEVYRTGRKLLLGELGIEPGPALQALEREILQQDSGLETTAGAQPVLPQASEQPPDRSLLVVPTDGSAREPLLSLAVPMARRPEHELIVLQLVDRVDELAAVAADLNERRDGLVEQGVVARAAAFTSPAPGSDAVQLAHEQAVALALTDLPPQPGGVGDMPAVGLTLLQGRRATSRCSRAGAGPSSSARIARSSSRSGPATTTGRRSSWPRGS